VRQRRLHADGHTPANGNGNTTPTANGATRYSNSR